MPVPASITITATVADTARIWLVDTRLLSYDTIVDPVGYVSTAAVYAEIISRAGLDETVSFINARITGTGTTGAQIFYDLQVTFGVPPTNTMTHSHDATTALVGLGDAYSIGPSITLDPTLGPVLITYSDDTSVDYLRIRTDTGGTVRDLFYVKQGGEIEQGAHATFRLDATYDIGSVDAGVTPKRPRDLFLGRNLVGGGALTMTGAGTFGAGLTATHDLFTAQATNPDSDPVARHVYVNSVDDTLRYWDGSAETILGAAGTGTPTQGTYTCPGGVVVADVVYSTGDGTVNRATALLLDYKTPVGIVTSKPTPTTCIVRYVGEVALYAGLTPGMRYWVGKLPGVITNDDTLFVEHETACSIGIAKTSTTLVLQIGEPKKI